MPFTTDQLGRRVELSQFPKRIVSLVPSQTELLYHLDLEEEVIGITRFCIHPEEWFRFKTRVGGTKQLHIEKIKELQPDLVLANKEENDRKQIEELEKDFPVWISDVNNLAGALQMIRSVGEITNRSPKAKQIADQIKKNFSQISTTVSLLPCCYLIWKDPYMTIGGDTFINDMLPYAGLKNIFEEKKRYPVITMEQIRAAGCKLLLLSSEPFPFSQKHIDEWQPLLPGTKIILVDGEFFSWYGSRLLKASSYFQQLQNQVLSLNHARRTQ